MLIKLKIIFFIFFLLTGGIQSLMAIIFDFEFSSSFLSFTAFYDSSKKPADIDFNLLFLSVLLWALVFFITYHLLVFILKLKRFDDLILNLKDQFRCHGKKLFYSNFILLVTLVFFPLTLSKLIGNEYLFSGLFNASYFLIFSSSIFLILGAVYSVDKNVKLMFRLLFLLMVLLVVLYSYISIRRSTVVYLIFALLFTYVLFAEKIKLTKLIFISSPFFGLLVFFTVYKYYSGAVQNEGSIVDFFYSTSGQFENVFLYFSFSWLGRLNNMSALYWYLYDVHYYSNNVFVDINFTFLAVLSNVLVFLSSALNAERYINGDVLEVYLFGQATGGNYDGGFAIPPIVEALWSTNSYILAFVVLVVFTFFILLPFYFFSNKVYFPILLVCFLYPMFLNPESIISIAKLSYRAVFFSAFYFHLLFKGFK